MFASAFEEVEAVAHKNRHRARTTRVLYDQNKEELDRSHKLHNEEIAG